MQNIQVIKLSKIKEAIFVSSFVGLAILLPMLAHLLGGPTAGRAFLPMHLFVLVAGLLLGWRAGLAVGLLTPLLSSSLTGMPVSAMLPYVAAELILYGLLTGLFREKFHWPIYLSLLVALIAGRLILMLIIFVSPTHLNALQYVSQAVTVGWKGILIQLIAVPFLIKKITAYLQHDKI